MTKAQTGVLTFEDGGRHHQLTSTGGQQRLEREGKLTLPSGNPEETSSADTLTLTQ